MALNQAKLLLLACLILSTALIRTSEAGGEAGIAIYWGKNVDEGSLAEACNTGLYSYISIAFLNQFGGGVDLGLDIAGHCDQASNTCTKFGAQIKTCQSLGVKVLLSIGGGFVGPLGLYSLASPEDAKRVAHQIWNSYLGGSNSSATRPFGDAVLDGIDFGIEMGSPLYYDNLAAYLKELYNQQGTKSYYLSAAPQCSYPGDHLGPAIDTGLFDFVWFQFFNNPQCQYTTESGAELLLSSWNLWASSLKAEKLFLGLPASFDAAPLGGYIPPDVLNDQILPVLNAASNFGGVMLWSRYYDLLSNYSSQIGDLVYLNYPLFSILSS
ncbi:acidic endochitinase-like [Ziziphus jujuba]|uniref:chitinase n=1 Tax=Ziziphus jujuba TaxID=326968 RepID=A0A6P3ZFR0_ZIZJJ|nr:acidic endochitinase-like [Ziziphus jujuba]